MVLDSDKILTAFIGAAIAFLLKAGYDWYLEHRKRAITRKLIRADLELHLEKITSTIDILQSFLNNLRSDKPDIKKIHKISYFFNTDIFKSNSFIDYHMAYKYDNFKQLVHIYALLENTYKHEPITQLIDKLIKNWSNLKEQNIENKYYKEMIELSVTVIETYLIPFKTLNIRINEFLKNQNK